MGPWYRCCSWWTGTWAGRIKWRRWAGWCDDTAHGMRWMCCVGWYQVLFTGRKKWKWSQWELAFSRTCHHSRNSILHLTWNGITFHDTFNVRLALSMGCFRCICTLVVVNDVDEWCRSECLNWPISWYFDSSLPMVVRHYFPSAINLVSNVNTINYYCPTCWLCYSVSLPCAHWINSFRCIRFVWCSSRTFNFRFPISCHGSKWRREKIAVELTWWERNQSVSKCVFVRFDQKSTK